MSSRVKMSILPYLVQHIREIVFRFNAHCEVQELSAVRGAKTAEPIEMQFGMLSRVGPGNMYYMGM